jgi:DNA-binding transcriptional LysR family regulator
MPPPGVKLGAIDLNLLVVFDAVMQERNVTRAGQRLGLSQPAMSHALTRLRYMLKDDLFIRSPKGMLPTPRAEQLALPVRSALDGLQHSLEPTQFIPSEATRNFRIAVDNYSAVVLVGLLAGRITKIAPGVTLGRPLPGARRAIFAPDPIARRFRSCIAQGSSRNERPRTVDGKICCAIAS